MKRAVLALALAATLLLSGCGRTIQDAAEARDECHGLGGVFTSWQGRHEAHGYYFWDCDLSDPQDSGRER